MSYLNLSRFIFLLFLSSSLLTYSQDEINTEDRLNLQEYCESAVNFPDRHKEDIRSGSIRTLRLDTGSKKSRFDIQIKVHYEGEVSYISCNQNFQTTLLKNSFEEILEQNISMLNAQVSCTPVILATRSMENDTVNELAENLGGISSKVEDISCMAEAESTLSSCTKNLAYCGAENLMLTKIIDISKPENANCSGFFKGVSGTNKTVGECVGTFLRGAFDEITQTLKFLVVDGPKWLYENTFGRLFDEPAINQLENVTSMEAIAASQASDIEVELEKKEPEKTLWKRMITFMDNLILQKGSETYGCTKWSSGIPGVGTCVKSASSWECASCKQKALTICGVTGYVAGAIVETAVLAAPVGVIAGTTIGLMSKSKKVSASTKIGQNLSKNQNMTKIVASAGVNASKAAISLLRPIGKQGYKLAKGVVKTLKLIPGLATGSKIISTPVKKLLSLDDSLVSKSWNVAYNGSKAYTETLSKTGSVKLAFESAGVATALGKANKLSSDIVQTQSKLNEVDARINASNLSPSKKDLKEKNDLKIHLTSTKASYDNVINSLSEESLNSIPSFQSAHVAKLHVKAGGDVSDVEKVALQGRMLTPQEIKAQQLAALIAMDDPALKSLIEDPAIAQYLYVKYFAPNLKNKELETALLNIVKSSKDQNKSENLFGKIDTQLDEILSKSETQKRVKDALGENVTELRPSSTSVNTYSLRAKTEQIRKMPVTFSRIKKLTDEGFSQELMDQWLFDFYGATQLGLADSQLRKWDSIKGGIGAVNPNQIENMDPDTWAKISLFASETEAPIYGYSTDSGEILRGLYPSVSAFMGKTEDQYKAYEHILKSDDALEKRRWCTNVWCNEEKRHEDYLERIYEQVSLKKRSVPSTYESAGLEDFRDIDAALYHLAGRNSSEWNANSTYIYLRSHSNGAANKAVDNVRKDESKHMAIFSAAYKHIYGSQPGLRVRLMLDKIAKLKKEASVTNSNGNILEEDKLTLFEMAVTHLFVEKKVRDYMKSLPLKTLDKFFDSEVKTIKEIDSIPIPDAKKREISEIAEREKKNRQRLLRWKPKERKKYLALKEIEKKEGKLIDGLITGLFNGFRGAEDIGSLRTKEILKQIDSLKTGLDQKTNELIKLSLKETLRDYQIMNNQYVRGRNDLIVRYKNAEEGFITDYKGDNEVKVLLADDVTDDTFRLRVEKPASLGEIKPGQAFTLSIKTKNGEELRMLSLASSTNKEYLEFAVGVSDSDYKQAFIKLTDSDTITITKAGGMTYIPDEPSVMIAGGIGITPFRSMLQVAEETGNKQPIKLIYANRAQIPFGQEFVDQAQRMENMDLDLILSRPQSDWKGKRGRVDDSYIKAEFEKFPENSNFYIVGPPGMVTGTRDTLISLGIPEEKIQIELFGSSSSTNGKNSNITVKDEAQAPKASNKQCETICVCQSVSKDVIEASIDNGASNLQDVIDTTNAGSGCGQCHKKIGDILTCKSQSKK